MMRVVEVPKKPNTQYIDESYSILDTHKLLADAVEHIRSAINNLNKLQVSEKAASSVVVSLQLGEQRLKHINLTLHKVSEIFMLVLWLQKEGLQQHQLSDKQLSLVLIEHCDKIDAIIDNVNLLMTVDKCKIDHRYRAGCARERMIDKMMIGLAGIVNLLVNVEYRFSL